MLFPFQAPKVYIAMKAKCCQGNRHGSRIRNQDGGAQLAEVAASCDKHSSFAWITHSGFCVWEEGTEAFSSPPYNVHWLPMPRALYTHTGNWLVFLYLAVLHTVLLQIKGRSTAFSNSPGPRSCIQAWSFITEINHYTFVFLPFLDRFLSGSWQRQWQVALSASDTAQSLKLTVYFFLLPAIAAICIHDLNIAECIAHVQTISSISRPDLALLLPCCRGPPQTWQPAFHTSWPLWWGFWVKARMRWWWRSSWWRWRPNSWLESRQRSCWRQIRSGWDWRGHWVKYWVEAKLCEAPISTEDSSWDESLQWKESTTQLLHLSLLKTDLGNIMYYLTEIL